MDEFTEEQKLYLQGFAIGLDAARARPQALGAGQAGSDGAPSGPEAIHFAAQNRFISQGKKLCAEEEAKRKKNPLDMWDELRQAASEKRFPKGTDVFLFKYHGMFYVAPAQDAFMCRLRIPGGLLNAHQLRGLADIAKNYAGGFSHVTTRANLQLREIKPDNTIHVITGLQDLGLTARGSGADNIRNITGSPTVGIDSRELLDTRPLVHELHHYILNHREMYGLPRKFNIAFDGGGSIPVLQETNDISFTAVEVAEGKSVPAGIYFRMGLGGITGHGDFARDTGVLLKPEQCLDVAVAVVKVFIDHGDRTDRTKARLKYVLDRMGLEKYLEETEKRLTAPLMRFPLDECEPRATPVPHGHIGFHPQRQEGMQYVGVTLPLGKMTAEQMHGLADIAQQYGSGAIRLTVWQNLLLSDIPLEKTDAVKAALTGIGLGYSQSAVRSGLVACTGNAGCRFAASDTKGHAARIADYLDARIELDRPVNIHLTGCHHSCAQHYIGDIGLLGAKVDVSEDEQVEGYHVYVGGGFDTHQAIGRELYRSVAFADLLPLLERMLNTYLSSRSGSEESFREFCERHAIESLRDLFDSKPAEVQLRLASGGR